MAASANASVGSVVIVGNGVAGIAAAGHVRRLHPGCAVHLVGDRHPRGYDGAALAEAAPDCPDAEHGRLPEEWFTRHRITAHLGVRAEVLDALRREVTLGTGERLRYDRLVLATGAAPAEPDIEGLPLAGVHVVCRLEDARIHPPGSRIVIVGAGNLGVYAAAELAGAGARVTLADRRPYPLPHLADRRVGRLVAAHLSGLGVDVRSDTDIRHVYGENRVIAVGVGEGDRLPCDVVLLCPSSRPNIELARVAGLRVGQGVVVDDTMRTAHPHVFATGAVAEHQGRRTTDWREAVLQARIAAEQAVVKRPSPRQRYSAGPVVIELDLPDLHVASVGRPRPTSTDHVVVLEQPYRRQYRKLVLTGGGVLAGGVFVNDPDAAALVASAAVEHGNVRMPVAELLSGDLSVLHAAAQPSRRARRATRINATTTTASSSNTQEQEAGMVHVERVWRIRTSGDGDLEVRLNPGEAGERQVVLEQTGGNGENGLHALNLGAARALAETLLEACEVATALHQPAGQPR